MPSCSLALYVDITEFGMMKSKSTQYLRNLGGGMQHMVLDFMFDFLTVCVISDMKF